MEQPTRCTGLTRLVGKVKRLLHEAIRALPAIVGRLRDLTRTQEQLMSVGKLNNVVLPTCAAIHRPSFSVAHSGAIRLLDWDSLGRPPKRWRNQSGISIAPPPSGKVKHHPSFAAC